MKENLRQIQQDLGEITDARPIHGAYYCEYEMFKSVPDGRTKRGTFQQSCAAHPCDV